MTRAEIISLLEKFVSGEDTSLELANELEVSLEDEFPDDDYLQETVEMLATYRPEGGEWVLGKDLMQKRLAQVLKYLEALQ